MTVKMWQRTDEWIDHSPCGGDIAFITDPKLLVASEVEHVRSTCAGCPVRPECIELNISPVRDFMKPKRVSHPSHSVWVAGEWLPEPVDDAASKLLAAKKVQLSESLQAEIVERPDTLL